MSCPPATVSVKSPKYRPWVLIVVPSVPSVLALVISLTPTKFQPATVGIVTTAGGEPADGATGPCSATD